jgi:hypothetical protein
MLIFFLNLSKGAYVGLNSKYWLYFTHNCHRQAPCLYLLWYFPIGLNYIEFLSVDIEFFVCSDYLAFNIVCRMQ